MAEFSITDDGFLKSDYESVTQVISPNCDERPDATDISLVVIHGISLPPNQFGGHYIEQLFCNQLNHDEHDYFLQLKELHVSSHLLIRRNGEVIQFVPFTKRAWHAGVSHWAGRDRCNDFAIGIELEGADHIAYEKEQYQQLNLILDAIKLTYPNIGSDAVVGHNDIAPGRKTDPGEAFDWQLVSNKN